MVQSIKESEFVSREEHMVWCKARAIEILESGDIPGAFASMASDLNKHPETQDHPDLSLGTMMLMRGYLNFKEEMKKFIEDFN